MENLSTDGLVAEASPFLNIYLVLVALMLGSFINLVADRLPRGESVVSPPSHCRGCGRRLNALDLLPVVGYVIRMGRCATCGTPIGPSAPVVEAVSGAFMALAVLWLGTWPGAAAGFALVVVWGVAVTGVAVQRHGAADH